MAGDDRRRPALRAGPSGREGLAGLPGGLAGDPLARRPPLPLLPRRAAHDAAAGRRLLGRPRAAPALRPRPGRQRRAARHGRYPPRRRGRRLPRLGGIASGWCAARSARAAAGVPACRPMPGSTASSGRGRTWSSPPGRGSAGAAATSPRPGSTCRPTGRGAAATGASRPRIIGSPASRPAPPGWWRIAGRRSASPRSGASSASPPTARSWIAAARRGASSG